MRLETSSKIFFLIVLACLILVLLYLTFGLYQE
jgi:hypothetical protein